jgi:Uma2 family endonuclease
MKSTTSIRERRWTRKEYELLIDNGIVHEDEAVELLAGHLVVAEPQRGPHARTIELIVETLREALGAGWRIRVQLPLAAGEDSEPEPDIALVRGTARQARDEHPTEAALVIEVAEGSLRLDRTLKAGIYARARVADYWIVNLADRVLEVYRQPGREMRRWRYGSVQILGPEAVVVPLAAPQVRISVADLLP